MNDDQLDQLLDDARQRWRVPPDTPVEAIWQEVSRATWPGRRFRPAPAWSTVGIAAALALIVGAVGGRYSALRRAIPATAVAAGSVSAPAATSLPVADNPDHRAMGELLGRTAVLLAALPGDSASRSLDPHITREGARLLTTTRLLLDSPVATDSRLRNLLQDLELVLAQVARLEPQHHRDEMHFIQTALDEHDIVPRLRSAAADLSTNDF